MKSITMTTKTKTVDTGSWDPAFWFAILSPFIGALLGLLGLFVFAG